MVQTQILFHTNSDFPEPSATTTTTFVIPEHKHEHEHESTMVQLPPQADMIFQKVDGIMASYPTVCMYGK